MPQHGELWPVSVSGTHRKARLKKKHVRLKTGTFHTNAAVSRWPWWETCNQVSLASAILVPHLHWSPIISGFFTHPTRCTGVAVKNAL